MIITLLQIKEQPSYIMIRTSERIEVEHHESYTDLRPTTESNKLV